jgi:hypothetical protein
MKHISILATFYFLLFFTCETQAQQVLVNQTVFDSSLGVPASQYAYSKGIPLPNGGFALLDNSAITGVNRYKYTVTGFDSVGNQLSQVDYSGLDGKVNLGTNIYAKGHYIYTTGAVLDTSSGKFVRCTLIKINTSTWDTVWTMSGSIDSAVTQSPGSVTVDDTGNIFIGITVQALNSFKIAVMKLDSNGHAKWEASFDSIGYSTLPVAMALSGSTLNVTGFMFDSLGHSDFLVYGINRNTGVNGSPKFTANGTGVISHPVGITTDISGNSYIAGTSTVAGNSSVIKVESYDSAFNLRWVKTWGDSTLSSTASALLEYQPGLNQIIVIGSTVSAAGVSSIELLDYSLSGTLYGSLNFPSPYPGQSAGGTDVTLGNNGNIYLTGWTSDGPDTMVLTASLNNTGGIQWEKTYHRAYGANDAPYSIINGGSSGIFVTTRSTGAGSVYQVLQFTQDKTNTAPDSTVPLQQWAYYENAGQIIDTGTHQASYVHLYTNTTNPRLYVTNSVLSYVFSTKDSITDTLQRIDLTLEKTETGNPVNATPAYYGSEQIAPYLNYYIGGLPKYNEYVHGYQRATAKNVYPNIDWQLYSDSGGLKYYYVVNPGGTPNDIQFGYRGADSIRHDTTGMKIYSRYGVVKQQPFTAWQYSGSTATQVSLTLTALDARDFYFSTGSYNTSLPLYIRMDQSPLRSSYPDSINNLAWSTYLGGSGGDFAQDIDIDNAHHQYVTGYTQSRNFPTDSGYTFGNTAGHLGSFLTKFDSASVLQYSSYYGGSTRALGTVLGLRHNTNAVAAGIYVQSDAIYQPIYIAGQTPYIDLPCPKSSTFSGGLHDTTYAGGEADGFVALFNGFTGRLQQASYIGSNGEDGINTLEIDRNGSRNPNTLYIGGYTMGSNFPFQNTFSGNFYDNQGRGVLMQLDANMNPVWTTGFGSHSLYFSGAGDSLGCTINDIKLDNAGNILIVGNSYFTFPTASPYNITLPDTNSFFVTSHPYTGTPPTNAFLAKFTPLSGSTNKYKLYYFSEYGDNEKDDGEKICANSAGDIYIAGEGGRNYISPASFDYITAGIGSDGGYISRFSPTGVLLSNGDYGGVAQLTFGDIFCDGYDNVFAFGSTNTNSPTFSTLQQTGWYWDNNTEIKCFLAQVNHSNTMVWSTLFGSSAGATFNYAGGMCIDGARMYICGMTTSPSTLSFGAYPLVNNTVSTFFSNYGGDSTLAGDAFVARFNLYDTYPTSVTEISNSNTTIKCYPNPSDGQFIVSFADFNAGNKTVTLYNYLGQPVYTANTNQTNVLVNANGLPTGMYIVQVTSNTKQETTKIVISK